MSKRAKTLRAGLDPEQLYDLPEAVAAVRDASSAKFDETIEIAIKLGVDPSKGEQSVRGVLALPHGTGKTPRVAVFAKDESATEAEEAGADRVGAEDLVEAIDGGWDEFDILVAHPEVMRMVGRLGKKLGPRMPNKKAGTLDTNIGRVVRELKEGRVEFKMDKGAVLHVSVGKASFEPAQLEENIRALLDAVVRARPPSAKGRYIVSIALSSTMGPGIRIDPREALAVAA
ncbi:MAG: 50S ribosomal protein L1 [Armatimonadota bacterium]|jgi:large subunit ribosomal protein L1